MRGCRARPARAQQGFTCTHPPGVPQVCEWWIQLELDPSPCWDYGVNGEVLVGLTDEDFKARPARVSRAPRNPELSRRCGGAQSLLGLSPAQITRVRQALGAAATGATTPPRPNTGSLPAAGVRPVRHADGVAAPPSPQPAADAGVASGDGPPAEAAAAQGAAAPSAVAAAPAKVHKPVKPALFQEPDDEAALEFGAKAAKAAKPAKAAGGGSKAAVLFGDDDDEDESALFKARAKAKAAPPAASARKKSLFEDDDEADGAAPAAPAAAAAPPVAEAAAPAQQPAPAPASRPAPAAPARGILDFGASAQLTCFFSKTAAADSRAPPASLAGGGIGETEEDAREQALFASNSVRHTAEAQRQLQDLALDASALEAEEAQLDARLAALAAAAPPAPTAAPAVAAAPPGDVAASKLPLLFDDEPGDDQVRY